MDKHKQQQPPQNFYIKTVPPKTKIYSQAPVKQFQQPPRVNEVEQLKKENDFLRNELIAAQEQIQILVQENKRLNQKQAQRQQRQIHEIPAEYMMAMNQGQYYQFMQEAMTPQPQFQTDNMTYEQLLQLQDQVGYVNRGMSKNEIKQIPKLEVRSKYKYPEPCSVCQTEFKVGETVRQLKCKHYYHSKCIKQWLQHEKKCPICKIEL